MESIEEFKILAFEIFHYQRIHNKVYHDYINHLGVDVSEISRLEDIPFLPIGFFRNHQVISGDLQPEICFTSSGTSGIQASRHYVKDLSVYETSFTKGFNHFYGFIRTMPNATPV